MSSAIPGEYGGLVFDVAPDLKIFAFILAISWIAGMLSGFIPAWESSNLCLAINDRNTTSPTRSRKMQDALVIGQVALSLVLMIAGGTAIRSSIRSVTIDPGYETKRVLALQI